ncbi:polymer-forming cytoskeletal protein [Desulfosporosinus sp.]|uniref:bactofilin family protein n=1 Tax=Desulfosporosinus sp. TaxID=157907 RepID=UPI002308C53C|nr:polymer-forming cytoskeletal protein [Desulfosporosinus sp.]MCO5388719.1 polymer-forming cytoskeletal protein [Desulfosporosinus sp.]MDA8221872.1 polymer-forming cytoskeletal protein [Desulfitobacterium hafniense]
MFKKLSNSQSNGDVTLIASECQITGSIIINGNARIDGKVEGSVQATGDLIIGNSAYLEIYAHVSLKLNKVLNLLS